MNDFNQKGGKLAITIITFILLVQYQKMSQSEPLPSPSHTSEKEAKPEHLPSSEHSEAKVNILLENEKYEHQLSLLSCQREIYQLLVQKLFNKHSPQRQEFQDPFRQEIKRAYDFLSIRALKSNSQQERKWAAQWIHNVKEKEIRLNKEARQQNIKQCCYILKRKRQFNTWYFSSQQKMFLEESLNQNIPKHVIVKQILRKWKGFVEKKQMEELKKEQQKFIRKKEECQYLIMEKNKEYLELKQKMNYLLKVLDEENKSMFMHQNERKKRLQL